MHVQLLQCMDYPPDKPLACHTKFVLSLTFGFAAGCLEIESPYKKISDGICRMAFHLLVRGDIASNGVCFPFNIACLCTYSLGPERIVCPQILLILWLRAVRLVSGLSLAFLIP